MRTTKSINLAWSGYDKANAKCMMDNFGVIFLDDYGAPIDDEYLQEELYENYIHAAIFHGGVIL